jgi:hypothetical protein
MQQQSTRMIIHATPRQGVVLGDPFVELPQFEKNAVENANGLFLNPTLIRSWIELLADGRYSMHAEISHEGPKAK